MNRFLVSNDDGIKAKGIRSLIKRLSLHGEVYVCAPSSQRSCMSQSMTLRTPITVEPIDIPNTEAAFICSGTPADCVKFGIQWAKDNGIDINYVFSGVNHGANGGTDIRYSGTMGAAMEGAMSGIKSIALSVFSHEATEFEFILDMIPELLDISKELDNNTVLNVNSPNLPKWKIKGVKLAPSGPRSFLDRFIVVNEDDEKPNENDDAKIMYPEGKAEYKYKGTLMDFQGTDESIDLGAIAGGYATITPIKVDATDYESLIKLNKLNQKNNICLFMNFQDKLIERVENGNRVVDRARRFAECTDVLGLKIMYSKHFAGDLGEIPEELMDSFSKGEQINTISFDIFDIPGFSEDFLSKKGSRIIISGLEAHASVMQTAMGFIDRGFSVVVLRDCCSSRNADDMEAAMEYLSRKGCMITTYEAFIYSLIRTSKHESIEKIRSIINQSNEAEIQVVNNTEKEIDNFHNEDVYTETKNETINDSQGYIPEPAERIIPDSFKG